MTNKLPGSEILYLKFLNHVLGVNRKASNHAVRGQLGFYPLFIHVSKYFLLYWQRFNALKQSTFLYQVYSEATLISKVKGSSSAWYHFVSDLLSMSNSADCEALSHNRKNLADKVSNFTQYHAFYKTEKLRFWLAGGGIDSEIYKNMSSVISELMEKRERILNEILIQDL